VKKKLVALILAVSLLMAGCSGQNTSLVGENGTSGTTEVTSSVPESSDLETESKESEQETSAPETEEVTSKESETSVSTEAPETTETSAPETTTTTKAPETTTTTKEPETTTTTTTKAPETEAPEPVASKYIALTFDDGPNTTTTNQILDLLEKYNVKGTFFLIGNNINEDSAKAVKRAFDMGCEIANHSKSHSYMDKLTEDEIKAEVQYVSDKIFEITGTREKYFRPPYIAVSNLMWDTIDLTFINGTGFNDWDDNVAVDKRIMAMKLRAKDGAIYLLHDAAGNDKTVEALETIIPYLIDEGYQLVTLSELFEAKGVTTDGTDNKIYSKVPQDSQW